MKFYHVVLGLLSVVLISGCATGPGSGAASPDRDRIVRLQIFLDERNFGPGKIDGAWGYFTDASRRRYLEKHGLPFDNRWEDKMGLSEAVPQIYTTFTIPTSATRYVGAMAATVEEQSKQKSLPYASLAEYAAERYHTTIKFLSQLNPNMTVGLLRTGDTITVPNVTPFRIESIKHRSNLPRPGGALSRKVFINTSSRYLEVRENGQLIALFPITPGSPQHPAPDGDWKIANAATMPWFRYDEGVLKRGERTEDYYMLPAGPNSPVGILWMGLSKPGIGIHGTSDPFSIGRAGSHGCIRLSNWNAARMPSLVGIGTPVRID